jgi:hypothetical protein
MHQARLVRAAADAVKGHQVLPACPRGAGSSSGAEVSPDSGLPVSTMMTAPATSPGVAEDGPQSEDRPGRRGDAERDARADQEVVSGYGAEPELLDCDEGRGSDDRKHESARQPPARSLHQGDQDNSGDPAAEDRGKALAASPVPAGSWAGNGRTSPAGTGVCRVACRALARFFMATAAGGHGPDPASDLPEGGFGHGTGATSGTCGPLGARVTWARLDGSSPLMVYRRAPPATRPARRRRHRRRARSTVIY